MLAASCNLGREAGLSKLAATCMAGLIALQSASWGACAGRDLFETMKRENPAALAQIEAQAKAAPFANGLLFKIEAGGTRPSYLLGTLHVADPRVAQLTEDVRGALAAASTLVLETTDPSTFSTKAESDDSRGALQRALVAPLDRRPDHLLTRAEFVRLGRVAQATGLPNATLATLKPEVIAILLATPRCGLGMGAAAPFLDLLLAETARKQGLRVVGLETLSQQLEALDGMSGAAERQLLLSTIVQSEHGEDIVETSIRRYLEGHTGELVAWMGSDAVVPGKAGSRTPDAFLDRLLRLRNKTMLRRFVPLLKEGGVLFAVGAAHLPGKDGLAASLANEGFRVTLVR